MRTLCAIWATAALLALGASCSVPLYVELFNNSGRLVVIDAHDRTTKVKPGESDEFQLGMHGGPYAILTSGAVFQYQIDVRSLRDLPDNPYQSGWRNLIRLQLDPDFRIFVIERGADSPISTSGIEQPEGFPLVPSQGPWPAAQQGVAADRGIARSK